MTKQTTALRNLMKSHRELQRRLDDEDCGNDEVRDAAIDLCASLDLYYLFENINKGERHEQH